jgi:pSer/pThr/pTyr-binding forkhead associated (FHA) protein
VQIRGKNIKIAGVDSGVGVYLVDESGDEVWIVAGDILENGPTKVLFICPALSTGEYQLKISPQYSGTSETGKVVRSYTFETPLTVGNG